MRGDMPLALLASFAPISADFQLNLWSVVAIALAVLHFVDRFRRKPPVDVDLVQLKGSIESLQKSVDELTAEQRKHAGHQAEIEQLKLQVRELRTQRETDGHTQRSHLAKLTREIFERIESSGRTMDDKIDALATTINKEFRDLYRALGKAEGQLENAG